MKNYLFLFFMMCTVLLMTSELEEFNADLLVNQKLLPLHLKNRHYIADYLILKEMVKLGLTNKEIFRILFPNFPHITKIAGIKIPPKIQGHVIFLLSFYYLYCT